MNRLCGYKHSALQLIAVLFGFLAVLSTTAWAQTDGFGEMDRIYIDSVAASPGMDVSVRFFFQNDEAITAFSLPITYDTTLLVLKSIDFNGSRIDYVGTRLITPENIDSINGHFQVGVIVLFEDPIPPGDGLAFTAVFTVAVDAPVAGLAMIDSLFYPPGGELILSEASTSEIIRPVFDAGKVFIRQATNRPPVLDTIADSYVLEGDSLIVTVTGSDPDGDALILAVANEPAGAQFVDNGDGTGQLIWVPDYIGPNSSEGAPYTISFWISDGDLSAELDVQVNVANRNRVPQIVLVDSLQMDAGDSLVLLLEAVDPDLEPVSWSLMSPLSEAVILEGPSRLVFTPGLYQSGSFDFNIIAADPHGAADSALLTVKINQVNTYTLSIDTGSALPGEGIEININLDNRLPISSFNLLVSFDPTGLIPLEITNMGTRTEGFESFSLSYNDGGTPGHTRITGAAFAGNLLDAGDGPIVRLSFRVAGDISLGGFALPMRFQFIDAPDGVDNTLTDSIDVKIGQSEIVYQDGLINVLEMGQVSVGDINLNGIAIEIADAIYFSNYFMDPAAYPFNLLQFVNSDVNYDGVGATLSDLVTLINMIVTGSPVGPKPTSQIEPTATVFSSTDATTGKTAFVYETDLSIGAVLVQFQTRNTLSWNDLIWPDDQMTLDFHQEDSVVRILLYSLEGARMPAGRNEFLTIDGLGQYSSEVVEIATADGRQVATSTAEGRAGLPYGFVLHQNYPNPFNPETSISFDLGQRTLVSLTVYNVLGQEVIQLVSGELEAGSHSITWRGSDSSGRPVGSGIYFYRLETETGFESRKMILLK